MHTKYNNLPIKSEVIAIDGISASGKSTIARLLAENLSFSYFSTGNIYRAVAYLTQQNSIALENHKKIIEIAKKITPETLVDFLKDSTLLNNEKIASFSSKIAAIPEVRKVLINVQRQFKPLRGGIVMDGRDIGTIIFPDANFKFFITANSEVRALRRYKQLQKDRKNVIYSQVLSDLKDRDLRDRDRGVAPAVPADDAVLVDTSTLSVEEAVERVFNVIAEQRSRNGDSL
jgi:CMP/dCMP kinase